MNLKNFLFLLILISNKMHCGNKIFSISIPKSGTWLLDKCVTKLTKKNVSIWRLTKIGVLTNRFDETSFILSTPSLNILNSCIQLTRNNEYLISHLNYKKEYETILKKNKCKVLFIIRDPRDQLVSFVYHVHKLPQIYNNLSKMKFSDLLMACIGDGVHHSTKYFATVDKNYGNFIPWMHSPICCTIKFENLVGPNGKGSLKNQIREIKKISKHIGIKNSNNQIINIANSLFGNTGTFRQGKIGSWKNHFSLEHKKAFKKVAGQLLIDLGYEKDLNW